MPKAHVGAITSNSEQKRREIVRAAAALFDAKGYHETSMDDIAAAVGLRKPSLYHYVEGKGQILTWIHDATMAPLLRRLRTSRAMSQTSPDDEIRLIVRDIMQIMSEKPGYLRAYFEHHREIPEPYRSESLRERAEYTSLVESTLRDGISGGIFRSLDVRITSLALFGMTNWTYQWYDPDGAHSYEDVADSLADVFLSGVSA